MYLSLTFAYSVGKHAPKEYKVIKIVGHDSNLFLVPLFCSGARKKFPWLPSQALASAPTLSSPNTCSSWCRLCLSPWFTLGFFWFFLDRTKDEYPKDIKTTQGSLIFISKLTSCCWEQAFSLTAGRTESIKGGRTEGVREASAPSVEAEFLAGPEVTDRDSPASAS